MIHAVTASIVVYQATGSALATGLVSVAQFTPQLMLSLVSGKWADLRDPAYQILVGRLLCIVGSGVLTLLFAFQEPAAGWWTASPVLFASLLVGIGFVVGGPAMQSVVPRLVSRDEMSRAMALNTIPMTMSRVAGPVLGALVYKESGPAAAFACATAGHGLLAVLVMRIKLPQAIPRVAGADYSVRSTLRYVRRDRGLMSALVAVCAAGMGSEVAATLAPPLASRLGESAAAVGLLLGAFGGGALFALVAMTAMPTVFPTVATTTSGVILLSLGNVLAAVSGSLPLSLFAMVMVGVGFSLSLTAATTLVQLKVAEELRGRVMAVWLIGFSGSRPLAAAGCGLVADLASVNVAFGAMGLLVAALAWRCRPSQLRSAGRPHRP
jgi:predicted MFS family arabinose efflux permease